MKRKLRVVLISILCLVGLTTFSLGAKSDNERVVLATIYFKDGSAVLAPDVEDDLKKVQAALQTDPTIGLQIEGYSDNQRSAESSREISQKRARAVQEWFRNHRVDPDRLMIKSFGDSRPAAKNDTPKGRSLNRRVEIVQVALKLPSAHLPATRYEFTPVVEGREVTHDFVIQNKGSALLQVQRVKTD
jgi:hypothetical protein